MTVKKILQKSDNLGTVKVVEMLDSRQVYDAWNNLGFGKPLSLIPSIETPGVLKPPYEWSRSDELTVSYGYGPMNTNLAQLARAYLVFGNDGKIPNLKIINDFNIPNESTQVFKKETVKKIAKHLDAVVSLDGSGYRARIKGHSVAGKTGTVNKRLETGGYSKKDKHDTFFSGFSPVEKPQYFMTIHLNQPKKCYKYKSIKPFKCEGSNSASMVFKETMEKILNNKSFDRILLSNKQ